MHGMQEVFKVTVVRIFIETLRVLAYNESKGVKNELFP
jgi:hypothetical protein